MAQPQDMPTAEPATLAVESSVIRKLGPSGVRRAVFLSASMERDVTRERLLYHPLSAGWVALDREVTAEGSLLHFLAELQIDDSADAVFAQLVLGLTDSHKSWLWPTEYEWSPEPPAGGIREGVLIKMTYQVPRLDRPEMPPKPVTYVYSLATFRPQDRTLEYRTHDHPLKGGALVTVSEIGAETSKINWVGFYRQAQSQEVVVNSMLEFLPLVFITMDKHVQARKAARAGQLLGTPN